MELTRAKGSRMTARQLRWYDRFCTVEPGLGLDQLSVRFGEPYGAVQRWAAFFGYPIRDRRNERPASVDWSGADWRQNNAAIARRLGVSRERVRQMREKLGMDEPVTPVQRFVRYVIAHRERLHGLPVRDAIRESGVRLSLEAARHVLREHGVEGFRRDSRWAVLDWRLPNRDLAAIHGLSQQYVANLRFKLKAGAAQWDLRAHGPRDDRAYRSALAAERRRTAGRAPQDRPAAQAGAARVNAPAIHLRHLAVRPPDRPEPYAGTHAAGM